MKVLRQHGRGRLLSHGVVWMLLELVLSTGWRFVSGQVVLREPGRMDARWSSWAPPVPEDVRISRAEGVPRTVWARRPGWHRQLARAAVIALGFGLLMIPAAAMAAGVAAIATIGTRQVVRARTRRRYGAVVAPWSDFVAEKVGHEGEDPFTWVRFPNRSVAWEPVEPLVWLTRERGWLNRRCPRAAGVLSRMAAPISERAWVVRAQERVTEADASTQDRAACMLTMVLVRLLERSRALRVWPRAVTYDLDHDDARIQISYPARYPAHSQDLAVIKDLVVSRLPGDWEITNRARELLLEFRRPRRMPLGVDLTRVEFAQHGAMVIPIGSNAHGVVEIPLKAKTPHVSIAASTGWGKTTTANVIAAHLLFHGWHGVFLDPKRVGFVGAFRNASPYAELRTTLEGQINAIRNFRDEMNRRYEIIEEYMDRVEELGLPLMRDFPELYFQPVFLLEDEKGSLTVAIKAWWKREGGGFKEDGTPIPGKGDPEPLMWQQEILWRGRAAAMHVVTMAQQNNLNVFLNSDMRDQYMFRVLSGPQTQSSWIMTFPGTRRKRVPSKKGRAVYGIGPEEQQEIQLARVEDSEARACAEAGIETAENDNDERAERLAKVLGVPTGAVSPRPLWVDPPAEIDSGVPGQRDRGDGRLPAPTRPLALVTAAAEESADGPAETDSEAVNPAEETAIEEGQDDDSRGDIETSNSGSNNGATDGPNMIVGVSAAADYLGIKEETFIARRKRMKRDGNTITGETLIGRTNAWPATELTEWDNLYRKAS